LGVHLFHSYDAFSSYVRSHAFEVPVDGITLLQEYIETPAPLIIRMEFTGGKFLYAVKINTSEGFELCPADSCGIGDQFCPAGEVAEKFEILKDFEHPLILKCEAFLKQMDVEIAGIEFIKNEDGEDFVYDLNTNMNYSRAAEIHVGVTETGMDALAAYLEDCLTKLR